MRDKSILLIVDPQYDFISGSLAVEGGKEAMDALAEYIAANKDKYAAGLPLTGIHSPTFPSSKTEANGRPIVYSIHKAQQYISPSWMQSTKVGFL